jgi:hypothetical protein
MEKLWTSSALYSPLDKIQYTGVSADICLGKGKKREKKLKPMAMIFDYSRLNPSHLLIYCIRIIIHIIKRMSGQI